MIREKLAVGLKVIFVGFNPSPKSDETGFNYAGTSNRFYTILHQSGLTERLHPPSESVHFPEWYGYGFTNIVQRPTKRADEILPEEYAEGRIELKEKLEKYKPRFVCYVGKGVFQQYTKKSKIPWGFQQQNVIAECHDFVAPGTSGLVRMKLSEQVEIYRQLADAVRESVRR